LIPELPTNFTYWDWGVVILYMLGTTWIGHKMAGKQATIRDFFLGGRKLPWQAVCGSIIATELSALTFIGVPGLVFAATGNMTYLQWGIGSIIARIIVGTWIVKAYYENEVYSPYEFIGSKLGVGSKRLTSILFFLSAILGQGVRLLVTATILQVVTKLDMSYCILAITIVAILWTLMGGMTTVIWTDVIQFFVFVIGGLLALIVLVFQIQGGWESVVEVGMNAQKFKFLDLQTDPTVRFTLWVAIFAMPFQNLAAFGTDQLNTQRMFCCRNAHEAGKAMIWSSLSQLLVLVMMLVGISLYVFYQQHPPSPEVAEIFKKDSDTVFPTWITNELPPGLSGLILAGAFAAAISSLDSILAALSQSTFSLFHKQPAKSADPEQQAQLDRKQVRTSRMLVLMWGIILGVGAILLHHTREETNLIPLAFGILTYTYGPLLGILLFALTHKGRGNPWLWIGSAYSILLVLYIRPDIYNVLAICGFISESLASELTPQISSVWMYPITTLITFSFAWLGTLFKKPNSAVS